MLDTTRRWLRRHRTPLALGVGVVGAGYLATQYVVGKIQEARERMSSDRIAKENLRRRFEQNQEDCTFTVLALLPTATANIVEAMNTEKITLEIQQMKGAGRGARNAGGATGAAPSIADTTLTEEEGKSTVSLQSESGVHVSQITTIPPPAAAASALGTTTTPTDTATDTATDTSTAIATNTNEGGAAQDGGNNGGMGATSSGSGGNGGSNGLLAQAVQRRRTKRQLWDDLTISSITRAFTLIYTLALLTLFTCVQLNLLGRRSYLSSVISLAIGTAQSTIKLENNDDDNLDQDYGNDFDTNRKYLTFSWWLLNRGWIDISQRVEEAVRDVFGKLSPRELLSFDTFSQLTFEVRKKVEGSEGQLAMDDDSNTTTAITTTKWLRFLLPPKTLEDFVLRESGVLGDSADAETRTEPCSTSSSLRRLLDETSDLIESPAASHVLTLLFNAGFSVLLSKKLLPTTFAEPTATPSVSDSVPVLAPLPGSNSDQTQTQQAVLLPKILSVLTRQAHSIGHGMPNEYLQEMEQVRDLEAFAAVVYSSNWENEVEQREAEDDTTLGGHVQSTAGKEDSGRFGSQSQASTAVTGTMEGLVLVGGPGGGGGEASQISFDSAWEKAVLR